MTALRPEREGTDPDEAGTQRPGYEDTAQFAAAVERLSDPLNDPLPGQSAPQRPPRHQPQPQPQSEPRPQPQREEDSFAGSPWFRPPHAEPQQQPEPHQQPEHEPAPPYHVEPGPTLLTPVPEPQLIRERDPDPRPDPDLSSSQRDPAPAGGRAARRKAAQEQARRSRSRRRPKGRRARGTGPRRAATAATAAAATAAATTTAPRSRVEARRAAKAAKDSAAVVASRVTGELFITLGVLMLLFVAYQLWWTNVLAHQAAGGAAHRLEEDWKGGDGRAPGAFVPGQGFAILYIPKLDVKVPIAEGIDKHKVLDKGMVGHYAGKLETAMPWDKKGNFAVAGHRNTHGEPFRYINKLRPGDPIIIETRDTYYTYAMASVLPQTPPSNISVIRPVPPQSGFTKPGRYLTLTTCTPEFTSKYRLIVWGKMVDERPRDKGKPDALMG